MSRLAAHGSSFIPLRGVSRKLRPQRYGANEDRAAWCREHGGVQSASSGGSAIVPLDVVESRPVTLQSNTHDLGKFAIGYYLRKSAFSSVYGAAGSLLVLLLWTYYSAQTFLFGAEITKSYSFILGTRASP
jgi:hypothetical protein